jgi:hypothetical protein
MELLPPAPPPTATAALGSELLIHCCNAAVLAPVYFLGMPVWNQLLAAPSTVNSISQLLQLRTGPVGVLFRTARIVFDHDDIADGTLSLERASFPALPDVLWAFWRADVVQLLSHETPDTTQVALLETVLTESVALLPARNSDFQRWMGSLVLERTLWAFHVLNGGSQLAADFDLGCFVTQHVPSAWMRDWCWRVLRLFQVVDAHWDLTVSGQFVLSRLLLLGLGESYRALLMSLPNLRLVDPSPLLAERTFPGDEVHVDRLLNIQTSGFWHQKYFSALEVMIGSTFNTMDVSLQPKYVCDMGCGDGALLKRIYAYVRGSTLRGKHLDRFPLTMIGADYNRVSRIETARNLGDAGIPHRVVFGDVGDPLQLLETLHIECGIKDVNCVLHVRSFLDHDRPFIIPTSTVPPDAVLEEDGAFMSKVRA